MDACLIATSPSSIGVDSDSECLVGGRLATALVLSVDVAFVDGKSPDTGVVGL